eukprot:TRINITY_DN19692_c0_g1_i1.p1 TRINITY_DN19692_c0_g1~~TRINITY_DN19692_c0_g1_i1.p1  ORF type:complete len:131 (-),score=28.97 TRINITY_DN19692_c0_g1_i1:21-413(-)
MAKYRILMLGSGGVGKTAFAYQFVKGEWNEEYDPTLEEHFEKQVNLDGRPCLVELLDPWADHDGVSFRDRATKEADGCLVVYSILERSSLGEAREARERALRVKGAEVPMVLCGNKADREDRGGWGEKKG